MHSPSVIRLVGLFAISGMLSAAEPPAGPKTEDIMLPPGAIRQFGDVRFRHPGGISGSALSPDGKRLATAAWHSVIVWDTATGEPVCRMDVGDGGMYASQPLAFSIDGSKIAIAKPNCVIVWDTATGRQIKRFRDPRVKDESTATTFSGFLEFTPDGKQLVLVRVEKMNPWTTTTEYYDVATWELARSMSGLSPVMRSPAGPTAIGFDNRTVVFFDPATGQPKVHLKTRAGHQHGLALAPDGKTLALLHPEGQVELWSVPDGKELRSFKMPPRRSQFRGQSIFTRDGTTLLMAQTDGISRLDVVTGKELPAIPHPNAQTLQILPDNDTLLVCANDGLVHRWSLKTGKAFPRLASYANWTRAAVSPHGQWLAIENSSGRVDLWDTTTGKRAGLLGETGKPITKLSFSPDGKAIALGRSSGEVEVLGASTGEVQVKFQTTSRRQEGQRFVNSILFTPDGKSLLAASWLGRLEAWDRTSGKLLWTGPAVQASAISPDGRTLVSSLAGPNLMFMDPATGADRLRTKLPAKLTEAMGDGIPILAFSPDGRRLFVATRDNHVRICDPLNASERVAFVASETKKTVFDPLDTAVEAMAFSPDGRWIVTGSEDRTVRVWEVETRKEVRRFVGHEYDVATVAFGPGSRTILSAGKMDGAVYQWDLRPPTGPAVRSPWDELAAEDAVVAYRAIWALADDSKDTVALLRSKLSPVAAPKADEIPRLIAQLSSEKFAERETASRALADFGGTAAPAIKEALAKELSAEKRERLQKLLKRLDADFGPADLRVLRAVQAMELAGTPSARELLAEWATGVPGTVLTEAAKAAIGRK